MSKFISENKILILLLFFIFITLLFYQFFYTSSLKNSFFSENPEEKPQVNPNADQENQSPPGYIPYRFQRIRRFSEGYSAVRPNQKWGYINEEGEMAIEPHFSAARDFCQGKALVRREENWGYINDRGETITPMHYDFSRGNGCFSEELAAVTKNDSWGYIDTTGEVVIPLDYEWALPFNENLAGVQKNKQKGFINRNGQIEVELKYLDLRSFNNDLAAVRTKKGWGYVNKLGEKIIENKFDWAKDFQNNRAPVLENGKWGFINRSGTTVINFEYKNAGTFRNNRAWVQTDSGVGFINRSGEFVIKPKYVSVQSFRNGLAPVYNGQKWGLIDREGKTVVPLTYEALRPHSKWIPILSDEGWNYRTKTGKILLENDIATKVNSDLDSDSPLRGLWFENTTQQYISLAKDKYKNWKLNFLRNKSQEGMYLENRFPFKAPTSLQYLLAQKLLETSLSEAKRKGWFNYKKALNDGFSNEVPQDLLEAHHFNKENLFHHTRNLDPIRPEYLMYYPTPDGRKLSSYMFLTKTRKVSPQVGGPLTLWHFHRHHETEIERCKKRNGHNWNVDSCEELKPTHDTRLMLHVWLLKHPAGPFASSVRLGNKLSKKLHNEDYLKDNPSLW